MRINLVTADTKTTMDRIYPLAVVEEICNHINSNESFVTMTSHDGNIDLTKVVGTIHDGIIKDNILSVELKIYDTFPGKMIKHLLEDGVDIGLAMSGTGILKEDNVVSDYKFISAFVTE